MNSNRISAQQSVHAHYVQSSLSCSTFKRCLYLKDHLPGKMGLNMWSYQHCNSLLTAAVRVDAACEHLRDAAVFTSDREHHVSHITN